MSFRSVDLGCPNCQYEMEHTFDLRGIETEEEKTATINGSIQCPNCGEGTMRRIWVKAPGMKMGKDSDLSNIGRMKESFKERFVKKELDDCRHKHGRLFDDSLRSAAAQRLEAHEKSKK